MLPSSSGIGVTPAALKMKATYSFETLLYNKKTARNTEYQYLTQSVE